MLSSIIQHTGNANQSGLNQFIFGQASTILYRDVLLTGTISIFTLFLIFLFRKELKLMAFDPDYAAVLGFPRGKLNVFLSFLATITVLLSIQVVGIILMSAMLIAPAVAARQWTRRLEPMILLSAVIGALSSAIGTTASSLIPKMPTGPAIVVALSFSLFPAFYWRRSGVSFPGLSIKRKWPPSRKETTYEFFCRNTSYRYLHVSRLCPARELPRPPAHVHAD